MANPFENLKLRATSAPKPASFQPPPPVASVNPEKPPPVAKVPEGVTPPWARAACAACRGTGFNSRGAPCYACDTYQKVKGGPTSHTCNYRIDPVTGNAVWDAPRGQQQAPAPSLEGMVPATPEGVEPGEDPVVEEDTPADAEDDVELEVPVEAGAEAEQPDEADVERVIVQIQEQLAAAPKGRLSNGILRKGLKPIVAEPVYQAAVDVLLAQNVVERSTGRGGTLVLLKAPKQAELPLEPQATPSAQPAGTVTPTAMPAPWAKPKPTAPVQVSVVAGDDPADQDLNEREYGALKPEGFRVFVGCFPNGVALMHIEGIVQGLREQAIREGMAQDPWFANEAFSRRDGLSHLAQSFIPERDVYVPREADPEARAVAAILKARAYEVIEAS